MELPGHLRDEHRWTSTTDSFLGIARCCTGPCVQEGVFILQWDCRSNPLKLPVSLTCLYISYTMSFDPHHIPIAQIWKWRPR